MVSRNDCAWVFLYVTEGQIRPGMNLMTHTLLNVVERASPVSSKYR
jgi:hypothetical protein